MKTTYKLRLVLVCCALLSCSNVYAKSYPNSACRVVDGDTLKCGKDYIRLKRIDAPEMSELGGAKSKRKMQDLTKEGRIRCDGKSRDKYGRILAECFNGRRNLSDEMLNTNNAEEY